MSMSCDVLLAITGIDLNSRDFATGIELKRIADLDAANERKYQETQAFNKAKTDALSSALAQGAPSSIYNAIKNASTTEQVILAAGEYNGNVLDRKMQQAQLANIYDQMNARSVSAREAVVQAATVSQKEQQAKIAETEKALDISTLASQLASSAGLSSAVGFGLRKSLWGSLPFTSGDAIAGTDRADFEAQANRLGNLLTLDNLKLMTGVLTDRDIQLLATAGSNLLNFNMSESAYKKEIERVVNTMDRTIENNGITSEQAVFYGLLDSSDTQTLDALWDNL
jgi:hypothetical protein